MGFERFHPAINALFFLVVVIGCVYLTHPVFLGVSYACAFAYSVKRNGMKALVFNACLVPLALLFALYYASYTHFGVTVLQQNLIGNNLTLESVVRGASLGLTAAAIIMWLSCLFSVFTADKVIYLLGRISPRLSLFVAIALRMVPRTKQQARKIGVARQSIGRGANQGGLFRRCANIAVLVSMVITWLLETLSVIAASMNSRGFALRGRTAFSLYRFDNRDRCLVVVLFFCITLTLMAFLLEQGTMTFDPRIVLPQPMMLTPALYAGYAALCALPLGVELWTEHRFRRAQRSIA